MYLGLEDQAFGVHEQEVAFSAPEHLTAVVAPRLTPTPVVLADWESTTPALLDCGCLPERSTLKRSRNAALSRSQVPSILHLLLLLLNQQ